MSQYPTRHISHRFTQKPLKILNFKPDIEQQPLYMSLKNPSEAKIWQNSDMKAVFFFWKNLLFDTVIGFCIECKVIFQQGSCFHLSKICQSFGLEWFFRSMHIILAIILFIAKISKSVELFDQIDAIYRMPETVTR